MNKQSAKIARLATTTPGTFLDVTLHYWKGRGYTVTVQPLQVKDGCESFLCFSHKGAKVADGARFSAKTLAALAEDPKTLEVYYALATEICCRDGLVLA